MLFPAELAFVGRDEIRAPLKTPAWEATEARAIVVKSQGHYCKELSRQGLSSVWHVHVDQASSIIFGHSFEDNCCENDTIFTSSERLSSGS